MTFVIPNNSEIDALGAFVNKSTLGDIELRLFTNDVTPSETDTVATFTEASFSGYSSITLTGANWTITAGNPSTAGYAEQQFTCSADITAINVYGYYMTRASGTKIVLAERFTGGPYTITNNGDWIKITPQITLD